MLRHHVNHEDIDSIPLEHFDRISVWRTCFPIVGVFNLSSTSPHCEIGDEIEAAWQDLHHSWRQICYLGASAVAFSVCFLFLMRLFAAFIIWTIVVCVAIGLLAGTGYCW